ncbi:ShlB/FhaC/HecB family hemolysin secretion/activation protein [Ramlibacter terrae]|uniref:ShlB/FhaC/HecB family hemolysin secretion/activation protein n=1 Tax=Ramlibacter terrae TaxID=2732511 RepID=A0ABX6P0W7_9BURK|nr:ShlB/FhaC/HecB family hemolysin secretion/activation protein [Ramlibacter terrae]
MAAPAASPVFAIRGFEIEGDNPLGPDESNRVLAPFVRADATLQTLQQATAALEAALRARGFGLHRVALPPQEVGATVKLNIVQFTIGRVDIEGRSIYDEANVRYALPELKEGTSPNFQRLAIQTAIANENPNKQVQVGLRESEQPDKKIDATITVREQRPWTFGASLSNAGSDTTGEDRFTLTAGHTNLFNLDHQFIGAYTTSLEEPSDVRQLGLAYKIPLYSLGGVIGASYTRSDVVGDFGAFTSTGAGHTFGVNYTMYLPPEGGRRSYVTVGIDDKVFDAARINDIVVPGAQPPQPPDYHRLHAAHRERQRLLGLQRRLRLQHQHRRRQQPRRLPQRRLAHRHHQVEGGAGRRQLLQRIREDRLWTARAQAQYSPDVLISGEQFGHGRARQRARHRHRAADLRRLRRGRYLRGEHARAGAQPAPAGFRRRRLALEQRPHHGAEAFVRPHRQPRRRPALCQRPVRHLRRLRPAGGRQPGLARGQPVGAPARRRSLLHQPVRQVLIRATPYTRAWPDSELKLPSRNRSRCTGSRACSKSASPTAPSSACRSS